MVAGQARTTPGTSSGGTMIRTTTAVTLATALIVAAPAAAQKTHGPGARELPAARDEGERKVLSVIETMKKTGATYLSVPVSDGRVLRVLTEAIGAKHVVEIGTSTGFSGLWFCLALRKTGGKLT